MVRKGSIAIGPDNDSYILDAASRCAAIVAGWGTRGWHIGRDRKVMWLLKDYRIACLGMGKDGHPKHPLYIRGDAPLVEFKRAGAIA
jgi:hypothetical protein